MKSSTVYIRGISLLKKASLEPLNVFVSDILLSSLILNSIR